MQLHIQSNGVVIATTCPLEAWTSASVAIQKALHNVVFRRLFRRSDRYIVLRLDRGNGDCFYQVQLRGALRRIQPMQIDNYIME